METVVGVKEAGAREAGAREAGVRIAPTVLRRRERNRRVAGARGVRGKFARAQLIVVGRRGAAVNEVWPHVADGRSADAAAAHLGGPVFRLVLRLLARLLFGAHAAADRRPRSRKEASCGVVQRRSAS